MQVVYWIVHIQIQLKVDTDNFLNVGMQFRI